MKASYYTHQGRVGVRVYTGAATYQEIGNYTSEALAAFHAAGINYILSIRSYVSVDELLGSLAYEKLITTQAQFVGSLN